MPKPRTREQRWAIGSGRQAETERSPRLRVPFDFWLRIRLVDLVREVRSAIPKLQALIDDLDPRRRDAQTRGRRHSLYLLAAGPIGELCVRPWAFDAGPPNA